MTPAQRAEYSERIRSAVSDGCRNQRARIERGEIRDPNKPVRVKAPGEVPSEYQEQKIVCDFLRSLDLDYFAVPNGGKRTAIEGNQLKYIGLKSGIPDLLILNAPPRFPLARGVALEMKKQGNAEPTDNQRVWLARFSAQGWVSYCAHGARDAIAWLGTLGFGR